MTQEVSKILKTPTLRAAEFTCRPAVYSIAELALTVFQNFQKSQKNLFRTLYGFLKIWRRGTFNIPIHAIDFPQTSRMQKFLRSLYQKMIPLQTLSQQFWNFFKIDVSLDSSNCFATKDVFLEIFWNFEKQQFFEHPLKNIRTIFLEVCRLQTLIMLLHWNDSIIDFFLATF